MKPIQFLKVNALAIAAVIVAGTTMSFKMAEKNAKADDQVFYYNSTDTSAGAFANPDSSHWGTNNVGSCEENGFRPCQISIPENETLDDYLSGKDNSQVLSMSQGRKP